MFHIYSKIFYDFWVGGKTAFDGYNKYTAFTGSSLPQKRQKSAEKPKTTVKVPFFKPLNNNSSVYNESSCFNGLKSIRL